MGRGGDPAGAERTGDTSHFGVFNHFLVIIDPPIHESKSKALAGIYPSYFHWLNVQYNVVHISKDNSVKLISCISNSLMIFAVKRGRT